MIRRLTYQPGLSDMIRYFSLIAKQPAILFNLTFHRSKQTPATWTGRDGKSVGAVFSHEADGMQASVIPRLGRDLVFSVLKRLDAGFVSQILRGGSKKDGRRIVPPTPIRPLAGRRRAP
jgi:hypothetical protein